MVWRIKIKTNYAAFTKICGSNELLYISGRYFRAKQNKEYSGLEETRAEVCQGCVLVPVLYLIYNSGIPEMEQNTIAIFADDTAVLVVDKDHEETEVKTANISQPNQWLD